MSFECSLVVHYSWAPSVVENLYLREAVFYLSQMIKAKKQSVEQEIANYQMWIAIIHSEDPQGMLDAIGNVSGDYDDEIGDMDRLRKLKIERGQ